MIQDSTPGHIYGEIVIRKDTCTPMLTAALFTIAKTQKQPKCPSTEDWIKKMWYRGFPGGAVVKNLPAGLPWWRSG